VTPCDDADVCAGHDAMSIACEFGHVLSVIMLGCRIHGPTAKDEVRDGVCTPEAVVACEPHRSHADDVCDAAPFAKRVGGPIVE
jgi:hypothetical protein